MRQIFAIVLVMTVVACRPAADDKEKKAKKSAEAAAVKTDKPVGFLTPAVIASYKPANVTLDDQQILESLNSDDIFRNESSGESDPCFDDKVGALVIKATKSLLTVSGQLDVAECMVGGGFDVTSYQNQLLVAISCDSADFSTFEGKPFASFWKKEFLCPNGRGYYMVNSKMDLEYVMNGVTTKFKGVAGSMDPLTGEPCQFSAQNGVRTNRCKEFSYSDSDATLISYEQLVQEDDGAWYASGTMNVEIADWTGTVTYSNKNTAPKYNLRQKGTAKNVVGTLEPQSTSLLGKPRHLK